MDSSLEHFKATINRRKKSKEKASGKFNWKKLKYNKSNINNYFPKLSEKELYIVKNRIREKIKVDNLKKVILSALIALIVIVIIILFILKQLK